MRVSERVLIFVPSSNHRSRHMTFVHKLKRQKAALVLADLGQFDGSSYYPGRGQHGHGWVSM